MPANNLGAQQVEANQRKSLNVKSQDEINNERRLQQMEEERIRKEGLDERTKEWADAEKKRDEQQTEILNQRKFFQELQEGLKSGKISPKETIDWEEDEEKTAEEIAEMDEHEFSVWVERNSFGRELYETRKAQEKNKIASTIAKNIELERENDWSKKVELMTKSEREKFNRQYLEELNNLNQLD